MVEHSNKTQIPHTREDVGSVSTACDRMPVTNAARFGGNCASAERTTVSNAFEVVD